MIRIREAVIVEGKYDKIKLSALVDGVIIETNGFRIFKDPEKMSLIRALAQKRGILILTDSDAAGFVIRNHLKGSIPSSQIKHAYIPGIFGKERRKARPSKEGKLGVEGVPIDRIREAILRSGATLEDEKAPQTGEGISKLDLFYAGLSGKEESAEKRAQLLKHLNLPEYLSANALIQALNCLMDRQEFRRMVWELFAAQIPESRE